MATDLNNALFALCCAHNNPTADAVEKAQAERALEAAFRAIQKPNGPDDETVDNDAPAMTPARDEE